MKKKYRNKKQKTLSLICIRPRRKKQKVKFVKDVLVEMKREIRYKYRTNTKTKQGYGK